MLSNKYFIFFTCIFTNNASNIYYAKNNFSKKKKNKLKTREYVKIVIDTLSSIKNIILKKLI